MSPCFPVQVNKPTQAMPLLLQPPPSPCLLPSASPAHCCCCGGDSWEQPSRHLNESMRKQRGKEQTTAPSPSPCSSQAAGEIEQGYLTTHFCSGFKDFG